MSDKFKYGSLQEKIAAETAERRLRYAVFAEILDRAHVAGIKAGQAARPITMIVGEAKNILSEEIDYSKPVHHIAEGACGFAWVKLPKANTSFVKWLAKEGIGNKDSEYGGWYIPCHLFGQSLTRKDAYCVAFSNVLHEAGITSSSQSRMD